MKTATELKVRNALVNFLVVVLIAWWVAANWNDLKAGARDGWAEAAFASR